MRCNTFREWVKKTYTKEELRVVAEYGCKYGFKGLTYTWELVVLYKKYKEEIWDILKSWATYQKLPVLTILWQSNKVNKQDEIDNARTFESACVWAAARILAQGRPKKRWFIREVNVLGTQNEVVIKRSGGERSMRYHPTEASMQRLLHAVQVKIVCNEGKIYVRKHGWRWVA